MLSFSGAVLLLAAYSQSVNSQLVAANNDTLPTSQFMTRPTSFAPVLDVSLQGEFSNGYIFMSPYQGPGSGPYIYDKFGNLVWDGFGITGAANAHNFHVCSYQGADHLCLFAGNQQSGYAFGNDLIVDADYRIVATIQTGNSIPPADQHEYTLAQGGETALMTSYRTIPFDLSFEPYNVNNQQGWLLEGVFQEVNVTTGEVLFEWFSSNHVDISDTRIVPHSFGQSGDGFTPHTGFDYFHINSLDKTTNGGHFLISARHVSTIYHINSTDQSIIWRLSCPGTGPSSTSDFDCQGFNFSSQHDARYVSENDTTTVISLFDNGSNGVNATDVQSSGMIVSLDHNSNTATLVSRTTGPIEGGILSASQGNTQILPNGNIFHGWGSVAAISEHALGDDGQYTPVLFANFTATDVAGTIMNYRAFSFEWQSTPANSKPDVYSYAQNVTSPNAIYVSWNGATTVAIWNFYAADAIGDEFVSVGSTGKRGFETMWTAEAFHAWIMVEALGPDGTSLRNSSYQPTFVPSQSLEGACDAVGCTLSNQAYPGIQS